MLMIDNLSRDIQRLECTARELKESKLKFIRLMRHAENCNIMRDWSQEEEDLKNVPWYERDDEYFDLVAELENKRLTCNCHKAEEHRQMMNEGVEQMTKMFKDIHENYKKD